MEAFLNWFNAPTDIDPVLKATQAHLWFVTIHPFDDDNGRIARAIADLGLTRSEGNPQLSYSMSAQIHAERNDYYAILEATQIKGRTGCDGVDDVVFVLPPACRRRRGHRAFVGARQGELLRGSQGR